MVSPYFENSISSLGFGQISVGTILTLSYTKENIKNLTIIYGNYYRDTIFYYY